MAFTVHIGTLVFTIQPLVAPDTQYNTKRDGKIYGRTDRWRLNGWFKGTEASVLSEYNAILAQLESGIQDVILKKDGNNHITLLESDHIKSPRFENFQTVPKPGLFTNHAEWFVDVVAEKGIDVAGIIDFEHRVETDKDERGTVERHVFTAVGDNAESYIRSLKPSGNITSEQEIDGKTENSFAITFTKKLTTGGGTGRDPNEISVSETIQVSGGIPNKKWYGRDNRTPIQIVGTLPPAQVTVSGSMESLRRENLVGDLKVKLTAIHPDLSEENLAGATESGISVSDFVRPGEPRSFVRSYSFSFELEERPTAGELFARFRIAEINEE